MQCANSNSKSTNYAFSVEGVCHSLDIIPTMVYTLTFVLYRGRRGRDRMVVGFTTKYAISAYHH
jgi:hypothetical protein